MEGNLCLRAYPINIIAQRSERNLNLQDANFKGADSGN